MFSLRRLFTIVFCFLGFCSAGRAQEIRDLPALSVEPKTLIQAAAAIPRAPGTEALIVLNDFHYRFEADGRYVLTRHRIIQVLNADGMEAWNSIRVEWSPWQETRPIIRARVINPDGSVHDLLEKDVAEGPVSQSADLLSDRRALIAPLPAIVAGSVIEQEIVTGLDKTTLGAGSVSRITPGDSVAVASARVVFDAPKGMPLKTEVRLLPKLRSSSREEGDRVTTVFEQTDIEPIELKTPFLPGDVPHWPYIGFSTSPSWQETARQYSSVVERQIGASDIRSLVAETVKGANDRLSVARLLLARLHRDVRYTGVEFGEASIVPAVPDDTLKRQYGDCKDKATVYVAMLRAAGIPASLALLEAGPDYDVSPDLPGFGLFDHAIVFVPGSPDIWVDATADTFAFGSLPAADQGRMALIVRPETTGLVRIPDEPSAGNLLRETREFRLPEKGAASVMETSEGWGDAGAELRSEFADTKQKKVRDDVETYAKTMFASEKVTSIETPTAKDSDAFEVHIGMEEAKVGFSDGSDAAVAIPLIAIVDRLPGWLGGELPKDENKRSEDIELPYSFVDEWVYKIAPAQGFQYNAGLTDEDTPMGPARLTRKVEVADDGTVTVRMRFDTVKRRYTAAEGESLRKALISLRDREPLVVVFGQKGVTLLQAGKIREAIGEYRSLIALHPAEALHHIQMSTALLAAGAGDAARKEAQEAVRLEPKSGYAWNNLGFVYLHDLIGRELAVGFDPAEAEHAYRKAIELEPEDAEAYKALARLFQYDDRGAPFSPKARLKEAIAEYSIIQDKFENEDVTDDMLVARLEAGDYADVLARLQKLPASPQRNAFRLSALALSKGATEAIAAAGKLGQAERRAALDLAGTFLVSLRRYPEASSLLSAMGAPSSNSLMVDLIRGGALSTMRRSEDSTPNPDDPVSVIHRLFDWSVNTAAPIATLESLMTKESLGERAPGATTNSLATAVRTGQGVGRAAFLQSGFSSQVLLDAVDAQIQFNVQEDHDGGYLIRTTTGTGRGSFFVVKQEGRFLIAGSTWSMDGTGAWIERLIKENRLATARVWLDWARDIVQQGKADDPLYGAPFPWLWSANEPSGGTPDVRRMRNAAVSLELSNTHAVAAAAYLARARDGAANNDERTALDSAYVRALLEAKRYAEALPVADSLLKAYPSSDAAFSFYASALSGFHRFDDMERASAERSTQRPQDTYALRNARNAAQLRGDFTAARAYSEKIIASGKADQEDWNAYAWDALYIDKADAALADSLQRNVPDSASADIIHTMAALMAEIGKTAEARDLILRAMEIWELDEPNDACWYVFGRIAEQFGLPEVALEDYGRIVKPAGDFIAPNSVFALAQLRLRKLPGH